MITFSSVLVSPDPRRSYCSLARVKERRIDLGRSISIQRSFIERERERERKVSTMLLYAASASTRVLYTAMDARIYIPKGPKPGDRSVPVLLFFSINGLLTGSLARSLLSQVCVGTS